MKKYFLIITLLLTNTTHMYSSESEKNRQETDANQGWGNFKAFDYISDLYNKLSNIILSWMDSRTAEQKIKDEQTNNELLNHKLEYTEKLIEGAEKQHKQALQKLKNNNGIQSIQIQLEKLIKSLEKVRIDLALLEPRLHPDYAKSAAMGIITNFKDIPGFNPYDVYKYLAAHFIQQNILKPEKIPSTSIGLSITQVEKKSNEQLESQAALIQATFSAEAIFNNINKLIQDQIKLGKTSTSVEVKRLRQILYLFQSNLSKQQFDAFLKGDKTGGLFSLQIEDASGKKLAHIQALKEKLLLIKAELEQDLRTIKAQLEKAKSI